MKGSCYMLDNAISKVKQDVSVPAGVLVLVTIIAFLVGVIVGFIYSPIKKGFIFKNSNKNFDADEYVRSLNFDE